MEINAAGDIIKPIDENNHDLLVCRRMECFFIPRHDGEPSADGRVLFHTEWQHYSGNVLRATSMGPQIERSIAQLLPGTYAGVAGEAMLAALKDMFVQAASPTPAGGEI